MKNISGTINDMPHQLFASSIQARDIYSELQKYFHKREAKKVFNKKNLSMDSYTFKHIQSSSQKRQDSDTWN